MAHMHIVQLAPWPGTASDPGAGVQCGRERHAVRQQEAQGNQKQLTFLRDCCCSFKQYLGMGNENQRARNRSVRSITVLGEKTAGLATVTRCTALVNKHRTKHVRTMWKSP